MEDRKINSITSAIEGWYASFKYPPDDEISVETIVNMPVTVWVHCTYTDKTTKETWDSIEGFVAEPDCGLQPVEDDKHFDQYIKL